MLPVTKAAKQKRDNFQQFLFNGFMDREALKKAIFDEHPNLTVDQREIIEQELEKLDEYVKEVDDAANLMSGMVEYAPSAQDYAYMNPSTFHF